MELHFKKLQLSDKKFVDSVLLNSDIRFCEYTFGNMFCWAARYNVMLCKTERSFITGSPERRRFSFPVGQDAKDIIETFISQNLPFTLTSLSKKDAEFLEQNFKGFKITQTPSRFDYIYTNDALSNLTGKKLASKRNHINAFLKDGDVTVLPITADKIESLTAFNKKWCRGICDGENQSLKDEMCAVSIGLENFDELGYRGIIVYKNAEICAYSYGEPINRDTFCVHVEKADNEVRGAYQYVNREFVRACCDGYEYINREDDAGDEGLRKAKLSYYPTDVGTKYKAEYKIK